MGPDEEEAGDEAPEMRGDDELDGGSEERVTCALHVRKGPLMSLEKGKKKNKWETVLWGQYYHCDCEHRTGKIALKMS